MPDQSLNDRLRETLRASAARRAEEAAADQLALSQPSDPETELMDEESDRQVAEMLEADARGLERAKFCASALVELWIQAGPPARELALTALTHSLTIDRNAASLAHGTPSGEPGPPEHLCTDPRLVCGFCLADVGELLPSKAQTVIVNLSRRGPLDEADRVELAADRIVSQLMDRAAERAPEAFATEPDSEHGSLGRKLADLLRES